MVFSISFPREKPQVALWQERIIFSSVSNHFYAQRMSHCIKQVSLRKKLLGAKLASARDQLNLENAMASCKIWKNTRPYKVLYITPVRKIKLNNVKLIRKTGNISRKIEKFEYP